MAVLRIRGALAHGIPDEDDRAARECLAEDRHPATVQLRRAREKSLLRRRCDDGAGIHDDAVDLPIHVVLEPQDQQTRLRCDRDAHIVVHLEIAGALPILLGDEHLHELAQVLLLVVVERRVVRESVRQDGEPLARERGLEDLRAAPIGQPGEQHRASIA